MSLSKLNQDCLLGIFRDCSLSRKLALRQVSASWCALLEYHLARLPSLSVTEPYRGFPSNEHPLVLLRSGRTPAFTLISRLFPSLRQLGLFLRHSAPCSSLTLYIRQLAPNLTVLTIDDVTFIDWSLLGEGQLSSLRHLTIHHASWFSCNDPGKSVASMRALLRPLETFTCGTLYFGVLHHLGPSLRRLEIQVLEYYWSGYPCINGPFNCSASKSLEHLSIGAFKVWPLHLFEMSDVIRNLLSSFPTIKTLHLSVNSSLDIPFQVVAGRLSQLQNLTVLGISMYSFTGDTLYDQGDLDKWAKEHGVRLLKVNQDKAQAVFHWSASRLTFRESNRR